MSPDPSAHFLVHRRIAEGHQDLSLRGDETRAAEESSRGHGSMETIPTNHFGGGGAGSMASSQLVAAATTAAAAGSAGGVSSAAEGSKDLRNFHTVTTLRSGKCGALDCRVLITGCGRSGTHFLAEQLAGAGAIYPADGIKHSAAWFGSSNHLGLLGVP